MGEIADALRRAREQHSSADEARQRTPPPPERSSPSRERLPEAGAGPARDHLSPASGAAPTESPAALVLDTLSPTDLAIVVRGGPSVETCRGIAVRVRGLLEERGAASVAIVSAVRGEGKTTVLCDLGLAIASLSDGREVALVDLDLRNPSLARALGVPADKGVEDVLRGSATLDDVRVCVRHPAIDLYPAVEPQRAAHELLVLSSFARMIGELEQRYAVVLIDTPPTLFVPDTSLMLRHVAACIPIARAGETRARYVRQLIETLPKRRILGKLLNGAKASQYGYGCYYDTDENDDPDLTGKP